MNDFVASFFKFQERKTTWQRETIGGITSFVTMAYIIFVNPQIMAAAGMDKGTVMLATCLRSSAFFSKITVPVSASRSIALGDAICTGVPSSSGAALAAPHPSSKTAASSAPARFIHAFLKSKTPSMAAFLLDSIPMEGVKKQSNSW